MSSVTTGAECRVCGGRIVQWTEDVDYTHLSYDCRDCGVSYARLPPINCTEARPNYTTPADVVDICMWIVVFMLAVYKLGEWLMTLAPR